MIYLILFIPLLHDYVNCHGQLYMILASKLTIIMHNILTIILHSVINFCTYTSYRCTVITIYSCISVSRTAIFIDMPFKSKFPTMDYHHT